MFCSECGQPATGKFCSHCGSPLAAPPAAAAVASDWEHEIRYEMILRYPGVREAIERSARLAPKRISGEQFLALADKLVPVGVSMETLAGIAQSFWTRLGVKTGKHRAQLIAAPPSRVLVRALCSLASHGQTLTSVEQAADGCLLAATLPSNLFSLAGQLQVGIRRKGKQTTVDITAQIDGQFYDWGKANRSLDRLLADLTREEDPLRDAA